MIAILMIVLFKARGEHMPEQRATGEEGGRSLITMFCFCQTGEWVGESIVRSWLLPPEPRRFVFCVLPGQAYIRTPKQRTRAG